MRKELDVWLNLEQTPTDLETHYAKAFLDLPDSMFFLATIDEKPIGGTAIYRDRTRLAMTLIATRIEEDHRESTPMQLFKASLPFFKTLAIRDVDALVGESEGRDEIPFPVSCKLQKWTQPALEKMGFEEVTKATEIELRGVTRSKIQNPAQIDDTPNYEGARDLLWNQRKEIGLSCSQQWLALDMASTRGSLKTFTSSDDICMAMGVETMNDWNVITFFVTNPEIVSSTEAAKAIVQYFGKDRLTFSLVGNEQNEIVEIVANLSDSTMSMNRLTLLRKLL
jgi:hypothetical protein